MCPAVPEGGHPPVTLFTIIRSVQFQAFMWGAGTALGELPPYFVARAGEFGFRCEKSCRVHEPAADDPLTSFFFLFFLCSKLV